MLKMKSWLTVVLISVLLSNSAAFAQNTSKNTQPDELAKKLMGTISSNLKDKQDFYRKNPDKLKQKAITLVDELSSYLDMSRMSWSIVGKAWRGASKDDKRAFIAEFKRLLVNTYVTSLLEYVDTEIRYLPYRPISNKKTAVVKSFAMGKSGKKIPITYKFYKSKKYGWRVYDVTVVGVSLVKSYKSSFARTLQRSALSGLIQTLKQKNDR